MQRDQGIVITMVIFILLTLILGVLTYIGFSNSSKYAQDAENATKAAADSASKLSSMMKDADKLKQIVGYLPAVNAGEIEKTHGDDAKVYAANIAGVNEAKGYRNMLLQMDATLKGKTKELADAVAVNLDLQGRLDAVIAQAEAEKREFLAKMQQAEKDLQKERSNFDTTVSSIREEGMKTLNELNTVKASAEAAIVQAKTQTAEIEAVQKKTQTANDVLIGELKGLRSPAFDREDGKVLSVNQQRGVVIVNVGNSSGLQPGLVFSVFEPQNLKLPTAKSKGSIEIVQVLGSTSAEARILESVLDDPIMYGDLIYTPVWKPGHPQRFALCGKFTLGSARDQVGEHAAFEHGLQTMKNLIVANGGEIDAYMEEDGNIVGDLTAATSFLILGDGEEVRVSRKSGEQDSGDQGRNNSVEIKDDQAARMKGMVDLRRAAEANGVRVITMQEFLRRMGWKETMPVQGFGEAATPEDYDKPQPSIKPFPVSRGTVSPLYNAKRHVIICHDCESPVEVPGDVLFPKDQPPGDKAESRVECKQCGAMVRVLPQDVKRDAMLKSSRGTVSAIYDNKQGVKMPSSPGIVSPLYSKERNPVKSAPGTVSGFYGSGGK
ncbi:MAG: hypothetical protein ACRC10_11575 [Thermoguttaceae bacterium]